MREVSVSRALRQIAYCVQGSAARSRPDRSALTRSFKHMLLRSLSEARVHYHRIPFGAAEKILDIDVIGKALWRLANKW